MGGISGEGAVGGTSGAVAILFTGTWRRGTVGRLYSEPAVSANLLHALTAPAPPQEHVSKSDPRPGQI